MITPHIDLSYVVQKNNINNSFVLNLSFILNVTGRKTPVGMLKVLKQALCDNSAEIKFKMYGIKRKIHDNLKLYA